MECLTTLVQKCRDQAIIPAWNCDTGEPLFIVPVFNSSGQVVPFDNEDYPNPGGGFIRSYGVDSSLAVLDLTTVNWSTDPDCARDKIYPVTIVPFCNEDTGATVYRREENAVVTWFDETGTVPQPPNITAGACQDEDLEIVRTEQVICFEDVSYVRRVTEFYEDDGTGTLVPVDTDTLYFNEAGPLWDSTNPVGPEPAGWQLGTCPGEFVAYEVQKLCEVDDRKLLLIDSGGQFAEYSFYDETLSPIAIPVPSAGSGADIGSFILYAITGGDDLLAIDVNAGTTLYQIPLFTNDGSPLGTSAASYDQDNGYLAYFDYNTDSLYQVDVNTAEVSLLAGPYTGIVGSGSSLAIDPQTGRYLVAGTNTLYELDPTGGSLAAVAIATTPRRPNGMTFDDQGTLYIGDSGGNAGNDGEVTFYPNFWNAGTATVSTLVEDWGPGVNSLAYYNVEASVPNCFFRRFGVQPDGTWVPLSDHSVLDFSPRNVTGAVDCCECSCGSSGGNSGGSTGGSVTIDGQPLDVNIVNQPVTIQGQVSIAGEPIEVEVTNNVQIDDPIDVNVQGTADVNVTNPITIANPVEEVEVTNTVTVQGTVDIGNEPLDVTLDEPIEVEFPVIAAPSYSSQRLTALTGGVVPANTHSITFWNNSNAAIRANLPGGNNQIIGPQGTLTITNPREFGEPAMAAGGYAFTVLDGTFNGVTDRIYIDYKSY